VHVDVPVGSDAAVRSASSHIPPEGGDKTMAKKTAKKAAKKGGKKR
jgi:hypothetical protein